MRAVIVAPGPSLARLKAVPSCDLSVAVNRAAVRFAVQAWSCGDLPAIEAWHEQAIGSPLLVAGMEAIDNLRDRGIVWRGDVFTIDRLALYCPMERQWTMFSGTRALIYAAFAGATSIDVYGVDWFGTSDFDGVNAGVNRSPDRWRCESEIWNNSLVPWLAERGVTVKRH